MTRYHVSSGGQPHEIEAVTFTQGASIGVDLRFIGENGSVVAMFTTFDWLKVVPAEDKPAEDDPSSTDSPVLSGE